MSAERRFFSGSTLEQAVLKAARHYGIDPDRLAYRKLERKHGFLRTRRGTVIDVDPQAPERSAEAPLPAPERPAAGRAAERRAPEPRPDRGEAPVGESPVGEAPVEKPPVRRRRVGKPPVVEPPIAEPPVGEVPGGEPAAAEASEETRPRTRRRRRGRFTPLPGAPRSSAERFPEAEPEVAEAVREALGRLFALADFDLESRILQGEDRLEIELFGADQERLLAKNGESLLAMQHLLPRLLRGLIGRSIPVRVDCDHFHEIREERLRDLAQREAAAVRRRNRQRTLDPMPPDERRIVHLTLADDPAVETVSVGDGLFKRVVVRPIRGGSRRSGDRAASSPGGGRRPFGRGPRSEDD